MSVGPLWGSVFLTMCIQNNLLFRRLIGAVQNQSCNNSLAPHTSPMIQTLYLLIDWNVNVLYGRYMYFKLYTWLLYRIVWEEEISVFDVCSKATERSSQPPNKLLHELPALSNILIIKIHPTDFNVLSLEIRLP